MSKHKHRQKREQTPLASDLVRMLQWRAEERCEGLGHKLGYWSPAKRKKHGVGSMQATCLKCGAVVFVAPYMVYSREYPQVPGIKGDLLFQLCHVEGDLL